MKVTEDETEVQRGGRRAGDKRMDGWMDVEKQQQPVDVHPVPHHHCLSL